MTTVELLDELRRRDVRLRVDGDRLHANAPAGAMTAELQEQVRARKAELIEHLKRAYRVTARQPALVPLQPGGACWPIFGVPGHNGDVFCYRYLAEALGPEQPFYGLQPAGLEEGSAPMEHVQDMAAYFAAQIRAAEPSRPCIIAGYCAGGGIALELARLLVKQGHPVALLALFGTPFPTDYRWLPRTRMQIREGWARVGKHVSLVLRGGVRVYIDHVRGGLERRRLAARSKAGKLDDRVLALRRRVEVATMNAVGRYSPGSYEGEVVLFLPSEKWLRIGSTSALWRRVARNLRQEVGPPECDGHVILREPYAALFARLLERHCRSLQPQKAIHAEVCGSLHGPQCMNSSHSM